MNKKTKTTASAVKDEKAVSTASTVIEAAAKPAEKAPAKPAVAKAAKPAKATKPVAVAAEEKPARKKPVRKPKIVEIDEMAAKLVKLIDVKKAAAFKGTAAVDIEVWGWEYDQKKHIYIEVSDGKVNVQPYDYQDCGFNAYISYADALDVINKKITVKDALMSGKLNAIGKVADALVIGSLF